MNTITEAIASFKPVVSGNRNLVLVTTVSGKQIWVLESQFDNKAETITYVTHAAGSEWVNEKAGTKGIRKVEAREFVGCGKTTKFAVLDYLLSKGVTPQFAVG